MDPNALALALKKRIVWDIIPDDKVPELDTILGFMPSSPDVAEMERVESQRRSARALPLMPLTHILGAQASDVLGAYLSHVLGTEVLSVRSLESAVVPAVLAVLTEMIEQGVIVPRHEIMMAPNG